MFNKARRAGIEIIKKNNTNKQISYNVSDIIEIPVVNEKYARLTLFILLLTPAILLNVYLWTNDRNFSVAIFLFLALMLCVLSFYKNFIFLICRNEKITLGFNYENIIYDDIKIKWADIWKIKYNEFRPSKHNYYHITIFSKNGIHIITKDKVFKTSSGKIVNLIAAKFYQYYGVLHGSMLKKRTFLKSYELKPSDVETGAIDFSNRKC